VYERSRLTVRPDGFALRGSGRGTIVTPARFDPGQTVRASVATNGGAPAVSELRADPQGRVTVPVDLGPASLVDEYPLALVLPPAATTVDVALTPVAIAAQTALEPTTVVDETSRGRLPATGSSTDPQAAFAVAAVAAAATTLRRRVRRP